ncbi:MAG: DegT/DnrJ/EryC1/StrS family aminotransferase [Vicinamibacterales bacterium]|nr:DegT/DnrJ/EryC1/StrS family aminotransferase [Vicinamibacterales bacterium]
MIPLTKPTLPPYEAVEAQFREIFETGQITNGKYVREFEREAARYLGVDRAVSAPNATLGLIVLLSTLPPGSEVIMPAFTFSATYQAAVWNGLKTVLVDCDDACNADVAEVQKALTHQTSAIIAVHMYGTPADVDRLEALAQRAGVRLFFDAAHAFGARHKDRAVGRFGDAEVFSLGPTKTMPVGEGGLITTQDADLADRVRQICNHGQPPGTLDAVVKSLNGRLQEINGVVGLHLLRDFDRAIARRNEIALRYKERLEGVPGLSFPPLPKHVLSTFKDLCIFIYPDTFGQTRDDLAKELARREIQTKKYYYPPIHQLAVARAEFAGQAFPRTERLSSRVLALPLYAHMPFAEVDAVCDAVIECRGA